MSFFRSNGLTIVLLLITAFAIIGTFLSGWQVHNQELTEHHQAALSAASYLASGHFLSAIFENWESEFLQMSAYVCLTAFLFQKGSAESKDPEAAPLSPEEEKAKESAPDAPWPLRHGAVVKVLYSYSLGIALGLLFIASLALHMRYSLVAENVEAALHGQPQMGLAQYLAQPQFWFESFQNWQSEFLSTAALVVLSIFLRFRGSPESKAVFDPVEKTG